MRKMFFLIPFLVLCSFASLAADLPTGKYVFIDTHTNISGTSSAPPMYIDFPTYSLNSTDGILRSQVPIPLTDTTVVITGAGSSLGGSVGGGAATGLSLYDVLVKEGQFTVSADGSIQYIYQGKTVSLLPGQTSTWTINTTAYSGFTGELIVQHRVTNYGIWDKAKIIMPTPIATATPIPVLCGDVNLDGGVNILDALVIANVAVGKVVSWVDQQRSVKAADVNGDGVIGIVDALMIAQYYVGLIPSLNCRN